MYLLLIYSLNTYMVCVRAHACAQAWHTCGQRTTLRVVFFFLLLWVLGMEVRSSGIVGKCFLPTEYLGQPSIPILSNMRVLLYPTICFA